MRARPGGSWRSQRLAAQDLQAAKATLAAHLRAEEVEGVARAVSLARRDEAWTPRDPHADMEALLAFEAAARAGM